MKIIRSNIIPLRGFNAITLWPFVFVRRDARFTAVTEQHERIHGEQQKEMLLLLFYLWYGLEWVIRLAILRDSNRAYLSICFEQEAYGNQRDGDYLQRRRRFAWLRYLRSGT